MIPRSALLIVLVSSWLAGTAAAQAPADSLAAASADTAAADGATTYLERLEQQQAAAQDAETEPAEPLFDDCTNKPEASVRANVTKVQYGGKLGNTVDVRGGGRITDSYGYTYDSYRRQNKTVENRSARGGYQSGQLLPFIINMQGSVDWSEDITTNAGGNTNINRRETRRAGVDAGWTQLETGFLRHNVRAGWFYNEQRAINQQQRNDFDDNEFSARLQTAATVADGVELATRLYRLKRDGNSLLAGFESPSSTTGDTLGAGVYYDRQLMQGQVVATQSSFDREFLDFTRNSNGLIDTTGLAEADRVIQELEKKEAWKLEWNNTVSVGRVTLASRMSHATDSQDFNRSLVGLKERNQDAMNLKLTFPVGRDSFAVVYDYRWEWDDQRYGGGVTESRGRQYRKVRDLSIDWYRQLFRHTRITGSYGTDLSQDIAEDEFNANDRDRLTEDGRIKIEAQWPDRFSASLMGSFQHVDDVSIRSTRSANNNRKRTYEVSPSYRVILSDKVQFSQTFRMYIQYQDYDYAYLDQVKKQDTYNKRGNLSTTVKMQPSDRLELAIKHDYNQKYNGNRSSTDAAGNDFYARVQDQSLNRIELSVDWDTTDWLSLQSATYRTKDVVTRFGTNITETINYSGEMWLGAVIHESWGPRTNPLKLDARVKRYLAYGPNVTNTSDDYWEADVSLKWTF